MTQTKYAIDACALIDACAFYPIDKQVFAPVWNTLAQLFEQGRLISSCEILEEHRDEKLQTWLKPYRGCFLPLNDEIQACAKRILVDYPQLIRVRSKKASSSSADPFLIGTAIENKCIIVTNETGKGDNPICVKIPDVCKKYKVQCINLKDFIREIVV